MVFGPPGSGCIPDMSRDHRMAAADGLSGRGGKGARLTGRHTSVSRAIVTPMKKSPTNMVSPAPIRTITKNSPTPARSLCHHANRAPSP